MGSPPARDPDCRGYLFVPLTDQTGRRRAGKGSLYVAVEPGWAALFPILGVIVIDARPAAQPTEEEALRWIDHDTHMSGPNHHVPGLRTCHSPEVVHSIVEIGRTRVGIRKSGLEIDGVHQM